MDPSASIRSRIGDRLARVLALLPVVLALALASAASSGCSHAPPVKPWERGYLSKRAMRFDDGLESRFRQHAFASREGAEGGYGHVGGGCGCN